MSVQNRKNIESIQIIFNTFKEESEQILAELDAYHKSAGKKIGNIFQKLLDNIPVESRNLPFKQCQEEYKRLKHKREKQLSKTLDLTNKVEDSGDEENKENDADEDKAQEDVVANEDKNEINLLDFESHLSDKLTSTVKKIGNTKSIFTFGNQEENFKIDPIVENSIIQEENTLYENDSNQTATTVAVAVVSEQTAKLSLNKSIHNDLISLTYTLKDGSKAIINLHELKKIDFELVDRDCLEDLKKIYDLFK